MKFLAWSWVVLVLVGCSSSGGGDGGHSSIDPDRSTVTLDPPGPLVAEAQNMSKVTVKIVDTQGNPLAKVPVNVSLSGDGGQVTSAPSTDEKGTSTASLDSTVAETKTVTVTAGNPPVTLTMQPTITFTAGPPSGLHFVVNPPAQVKAGQVVTPPVRLVLQDVNGNFAPSVPCGVQLRLVYSNNGVLSGGSSQMSVDGGLTFDMLSINRVQAGYALRAEVVSGPAMGSAEESTKFDVVVGDVSQATSTLLAMPVNVTADGTSTTTLTVTLLDLGLNPVSGQPISLSVSGTGNTLGASSGSSDATGTFTTTLKSTVSEMKTVTATSGTVQLTTMVNFTP